MNGSSGPSIVVTGVGVVCGWGWGRERFWDGVCSGGTSVRRFDRIDTTDYLTRIAAEVPDAGLLPSPHPSRRSLADGFALAAAGEALDGARLPEDLSDRLAGVYFGSSTGGMYESEEYYERLLRRPGAHADIRRLAPQQVSAPAEAVARRFGVHGPVETISSACASSTLAIGTALDALRDRTVQLAVAGGADSLCRITYAGFNALRSVDTEPTTPFRSGRGGLSLGEGAAVLVLETEASALERGVTPLAVLAGTGSSCDAHHMTAPDPEGHGAATALCNALEDADLSPDRVDFINAHGTGTPLNDAAEYAAFVRVFGERAASIPVAATKGSVGHLLGTAGAIESVATVLSLQEQIVPPAPGPDTIDPETPVRLVVGESMKIGLQVGVTLNLAFGGCNGALVFERWAA